MRTDEDIYIAHLIGAATLARYARADRADAATMFELTKARTFDMIPAEREALAQFDGDEPFEN